MHSDLHHDSYQRLRDAAMHQSEALRRQAINYFWRQLGLVIRRGLRFAVSGKASARAQEK